MTKQRNYYQLNENEKIIGSSGASSVVFDKGGFILTNHRVIKVNRTAFGGESVVHTINLNKIDSILNQTKKNIPSLIIGGILVAIGLMYIEDAGGIALLIGLVLIIFYFSTRKRVVTISSGRTDMYLDVSSMSHNSVQKLVHSIENAKQNLSNSNIQKSTNSESKSNLKSDSIDRLREITKLYESNLISESEFELKKKEILKDI